MPYAPQEVKGLDAEYALLEWEATVADNFDTVVY
jgi:hypothetical protein